MSYPRIVENHGYFQGVGGLRLHYRTWEARAPRAAVIVVHGLAEHVGRYQELGRALAAEDIACFAHDLRGHGMSEGRRGHVRAFDVLLQDLERFRREVPFEADVVRFGARRLDVRIAQGSYAIVTADVHAAAGRQDAEIRTRHHLRSGGTHDHVVANIQGEIQRR